VDHARAAGAAGRRRAALEPNEHPAAKSYQKKIFADGIPAAMFGVDDIHAEYRRLVEAGVTFTMEPTTMGNVTVAVFDDTCGNLIQSYRGICNSASSIARAIAPIASSIDCSPATAFGSSRISAK
jgi:hypothetical protein